MPDEINDYYHFLFLTACLLSIVSLLSNMTRTDNSDELEWNPTAPLYRPLLSHQRQV